MWTLGICYDCIVINEQKETQGIYLVAKVVITNGSQVLLLKRSGTDLNRPYEWDLPGGVVKVNEDPTDAVMREAKEETGIIFSNPRIIKVHHEYKERYEEYVLTLIYHTTFPDKEVKLNPEHDAYEWVDIKNAINYKMPNKYHEAIALLE